MAQDEPFPVAFNELLAAEYNYIAQTALQANEDRACVSSFYLIAVGSLVAAISGALSYYQAIEVALISELMLGAAVYFLQRVVLPPQRRSVVPPSCPGGITIIFVQLFIYRQALK